MCLYVRKYQVVKKIIICKSIDAKCGRIFVRDNTSLSRVLMYVTKHYIAHLLWFSSTVENCSTNNTIVWLNNNLDRRRLIRECFQHSKERTKGAPRYKYVNISLNRGPCTPKERNEQSMYARIWIRATRNNGRKKFPRAFLPRRCVTNILHNNGREDSRFAYAWHVARRAAPDRNTTARVVCHKHALRVYQPWNRRDRWT